MEIPVRTDCEDGDGDSMRTVMGMASKSGDKSSGGKAIMARDTTLERLALS